MARKKETMIIEVNGIKMEVDTRHAKRIDTFSIGTRVKLHRRKSQYDSSKVFPGVVVGFEPFEDLPTIVVAYIEHSWNSVAVETVYINAENDKYDLIADIDGTETIDKEVVFSHFQSEREKLQAKIDDLDRKEQYFKTFFGAYWDDVKAEGAA